MSFHLYSLQKMLASTTDVVLLEDVPGASLGDRQPEELTVLELKWWLACRGATRSGLKALVQQVKDYIQSGLQKHIIDPDKGENMEVKRRCLGIVPGNHRLPLKAPKN